MIRTLLASLPAALCTAAMALAAPAPLAEASDLAAIDDAVARFTGVATGAPGGGAAPVDRRLRLVPCALPLALAWYGAARGAVQVDCPVPGGWRLYVPVPAGGGPAAPAVARGDALMIAISGEGFAVAQPGEALEAGAVGAWIKVRAAGPAAQPVRARVLRPGVVGMELP